MVHHHKMTFYLKLDVHDTGMNHNQGSWLFFWTPLELDRDQQFQQISMGKILQDAIEDSEGLGWMMTGVTSVC